MYSSPFQQFSQHWIIVIGGVVAFLLTYGLTFGIIALCRKVALFNRREEGKLFTGAIPRLGGVGIFLTFLVVSLCLYPPSLNTPHADQEIIFGHTYPKDLVMYALFLAASLLVVIVYAYDDIKGLKPLPKLLAQTVAVIILLGPGLHTFHGVLFFGFNNPFASDGTLTLFIREPIVSWLAIPAILFTWFWVAGMMNAINFIDGLDGLAGGIVAIVGLFITLISWRMGQYSLAILSAIFTGAVAGFLPHNWNPARIIMGDSGAQFLGMALAVLSVISGAKFALILMILGIPILDIALVMVNRIRRGQNPMKSDILQLHYRKTHLHYRFLFGGLSPRQICYILYSVTFAFGLLALQLQRIYKFLGFGLVGVVMISLLIWSSRLQNKREAEKQQALAEEQPQVES
jgi:UDP-GlcNAc:undecaprenyl-phosphate GlcNAc-1-phosphate transferase